MTSKLYYTKEIYNYLVSDSIPSRIFYNYNDINEYIYILDFFKQLIELHKTNDTDLISGKTILEIAELIEYILQEKQNIIGTINRQAKKLIDYDKDFLRTTNQILYMKKNKLLFKLQLTIFKSLLNIKPDHDKVYNKLIGIITKNTNVTNKVYEKYLNLIKSK